VWTNNKVTNKRGDNTLLARPGQYLQDHLQWTAKRTQEIWDMVYLPRLYFATIDKQILRGISTQIALVHDLGKVTRYFQDRVINIESENYYHTQLSSVVVFYEVLEYLADYPENVRYTLSYIASIIVKKHHLGLINLEGDWQLTREEIVMIQKQVQDIDVIELDYLVSKLDGLYMPFTLDQLREWCNTIQTDLVTSSPQLIEGHPDVGWQLSPQVSQHSGSFPAFIALALRGVTLPFLPGSCPRASSALAAIFSAPTLSASDW